ncbi:PAS domain S-box-containing protein [Geopseudomonas sagittaria]|uniref:PAS domain S-box-containing protein n=1 Tax=Geopseudomonas sagittaria TaxID=1135990 RepID=A0A1I5Z1E3_9GAMM|nr:PAS domain S-box-containing protein [Pseudomonas sagittaria]
MSEHTHLAQPDGLAGLTERERQTLALIAEGLSNKLIARQLGISDGTVKVHVRHLLCKLSLHSRLELAAWAYRCGGNLEVPAQGPQALPVSPPGLGNLLDDLPLMVYRCRNDPQWSMAYVSAGCLELTGYSAAQLLGGGGLTYSSLIHPGDRRHVWSSVQRGLQEVRAFSFGYRLLCADGSERVVEERGCGIYADNGEVLGLEGVVMAR